ncbi:YhgE/Pip family protein [Microbacterium sp.]|uniref:YhgE/Pip family protein n=1 Tax=Microbacterium sp. TaxID=51671 RepID=UPI0025F43744|nr:YhgE/Pip family protein [Microbacterium sp.]
MTLPFERARSRKPVTWMTLTGVLLLPVVIGGLLVVALYNPTERLGEMRAAIVNNDEPVTIDDQLVPLGRQLTAGLVEGSDDLPSNLDWTISNTDDARSGLADGTYEAVITIPANFSAAATSTAGASDGSGGTPEKATISIATAPDSLIVDDAITAQVAEAAASATGQQLSTVFLENVFLGFTTLGDELGQAATGAHQLAEGAAQAATGAAALPAGASALSSGAMQLGGGVGELSNGLSQLAGGTRQSASGAGALADGLTQISAQLTATADGTLGGTAAANVRSANDAAAATGSLATSYETLRTQNECTAPRTPDQVAVCAALDQLAVDVQRAATSAGYAAGYAGGIQRGLGQTAIGIDRLASGATDLRSGLGTVAGGIDQSASGASALSTGVNQLADGADELAAGASQLADGVSEVATGTSSLADGLTEASGALPSYTDQQATDLAAVVADPVTTEGVGSNIFGASAIPLLGMLALWFGGLGSFVALQAVPRHALSSRRPSVLLALRSLLPAAAIGAGQGFLLAVVVQLAASYEWSTWVGFAALSVLAGVAFAAVNQALIGVFGGAGRWISALIGVLAVATGVVSTVPGVLTSVAGLMPTTPAYQAMLGALTDAGGIGAGVAGMILWAVLAFGATVLAVARRRTVSAEALLATSASLA